MTKAQDAFQKAKSAYLNGKIDWKKFEGVMAKIGPVLEAEGTPINLSRIKAWHGLRLKHYQLCIRDADPTSFDSKTWKKVKKEAGIKKTGFLKKSDASVGKHLKSYQSAFKKYQANLADPLGQGVKACQDMLVANRKLQDSFDSFLGAKEFKSDLAKDLQAECTAMKKKLEDQHKALASYAMNTKKEADQMSSQLDNMFNM